LKRLRGGGTGSPHFFDRQWDGKVRTVTTDHNHTYQINCGIRVSRPIWPLQNKVPCTVAEGTAPHPQPHLALPTSTADIFCSNDDETPSHSCHRQTKKCGLRLKSMRVLHLE
jgi:hypothetical protein